MSSKLEGLNRRLGPDIDGLGPWNSSTGSNRKANAFTVVPVLTHANSRSDTWETVHRVSKPQGEESRVDYANNWEPNSTRFVLTCLWCRDCGW